jgi:hypothetical protein
VSIHNRHVSATGRLLRMETIALAPSGDGYPHMTAQVTAASYLVAPTASAAPGGATAKPAVAGAPATPATTPSPTTATITGAAR